MKMKKIFLGLLFVVSFHGIIAQTNEKDGLDKVLKLSGKVIDTNKIGWKRGGNIVFLFNQSSFNNAWLGGGTSSMAGNLVLNYDFNYTTKNIIWDNKIITAYGLTKQQEKETTKSDDRIEFVSLYGRKTGTKNWYFSAFLNFKTQMDSGFDLDTNTKISHFFSPAYLQVGPGLLWKKSDNLKVNIAPATSRLIVVDKDFTEFGPSFGVEQGDAFRFEFGAAVNAYYKLNLMANVSMENILNLYSNYLDKPENVDVDYQMNLVMKVNKYISANVAFQAIYDDNANPVKSEVQVREVFGLGVNYTF